MPSFRKAKNQARHVLEKSSAIGKPRHQNKSDFYVHSIGTSRNYEQALIRLGKWMKDHKLGSLHSLTTEDALRYLNERKDAVKQKTLDQDRQAIQLCLQEKLPVIKSSVETVLKGRAYTSEQVSLITSAQNPTNALATKIAHTAGLRAHELLTLRRIDEGEASPHRKWVKERFVAMNGNRYLVTGKGGLTREVLVAHELSTELEQCRLPAPVRITDRGVHYERYYNIAGGHAWSNSFTRASQRILGWSRGAHGLRHAYAQERVDTLQRNGFLYDEALGVVSQELGHFRSDITEVYLR